MSTPSDTEVTKSGEAAASESAMAKAGSFLKETRSEFHKITWPHGKELRETTKMVCVFIVLLAVFVWICDVILSWALRLVM